MCKDQELCMKLYMSIHGSNYFPFFFRYRKIIKMNKRTGSKVQFMSDHPEFGRLDSLDIYADEFRDGNTISF